ncbi:MarR family winged helix-turn-helix transcriptional regulator [Cellulomonas fimi]|uniref:Transcriptional regulator, MarR family n=1 Tax=Cellulomonas fimi (strain ATCC 484 / DSM 20113 / JCM 1341 / CCUG 24087 / LMG 16345 / NBRC 15513 / NCIMB 8980 / NCTC 7547 / NRS-133) TaxID=590998 RepID=F4H3M2_CELFA|nr:MarR family transcriptional regulator [Cellulomonas fimi]AEE47688.1 transcriptional regulator, MarR family [Cellulomonas fimi ATCC 484]NNH07443.1 MarR family transcriptional regulator [Cellulomonas fimi]VEH36799.1 Organic hydroperoxide resistance transcriptional regulator [Cellulomonas fimi]
MATPAATAPAPETGTHDPLAVEAQLCLATSAAARALVGLYRSLLDPLGLTHPQYLAMLALWQHGDLSLKELATVLQLDAATTSPLVRRLEMLGLVTRRRSSTDERLLVIALTDDGRAMRADAVGIPAAMVDRLGLSRETLDEIRSGVETLLDACRRATQEAGRAS